MASCLGVSCSGRIESDDPAAVAATAELTPESAVEPGAEASPLARFVVKARDDEQAERLPAEVAARFGPGVEVRPLFDQVPEGDPDGMRRMFRVAVPRQNLPSEQPWENAYQLEESLGLEAAEPDLESTLEASLEMGQICLVDDPPPTDKGWSLKEIHAPEAWALMPAPGGRRFGEGVSVCHPDTGWSEHVDLDAGRLDLSRARNLLRGGSADGRDPFDDDGPMLNPGHGTGTGSVIVSGHAQGEVLGVAPGATLVPIRTARSVVQVFDSDLARAVNYAVDAGCDVVSMSLGGRTFFGLQAAIRRAVRSQLIVAAAAGNCVRFVVAPAAYEDTLAVAGSNVQHRPWKGSSRGSEVDVSAPAEHVWIANRRRTSDPTTGSAAGQGTSYAVANVAGGAALWLAFHGRDQLVQRYGPGVPLQEVFRTVLRSTARVPAGWNADRFGAGILDVEALLRAPLPAPEELGGTVTERGATELALLGSVLGRSPEELGPLVASLFGVPLLDVEDRLRELGPELVQIALSDPVAFERLLESLAGQEAGNLEAAPESAPFAAASAQMRNQLAR